MSFKNNLYVEHALVLGGETFQVAITDTQTSYYTLRGSGALSGNIDIPVPVATPSKGGILFVFFYSGSITKGAFTFTVFGVSWTAQQLLEKQFVVCEYSTTNAAWKAYQLPDLATLQVESANILDLAVTTAKINDLAVTTGKINDLAVTTAKINTDAVTTVKILDLNVTTAKINTDAVTTVKILDENVTLAKLADLTRGSIISGQGAGNRPTALDAKTTGQVLTGDGTDIVSAPLTGDITAAVAAGNFVTTIGAGKVTTAKILAANVTPGKLSTLAASFTTTFPVSFESGEVTAQNLFYVRGNFTIAHVYATVIKAIAGTDDATITFKIDGTTVTGATLTLTASSALNTSFDAAPTGLFTYSGGATSALQALTAKTTAGGKAMVTVIFTKID